MVTFCQGEIFQSDIALVRSLFIFSGAGPLFLQLKINVNLIIQDRVKCWKSHPAPLGLLHSFKLSQREIPLVTEGNDFWNLPWSA